MKSLADQVLDDKAKEYHRDLIGYQKKYYEELMRMKNKPRIVLGGRKNYHIMMRNEVIAHGLTLKEAEAFVKLMEA